VLRELEVFWGGLFWVYGVQIHGVFLRTDAESTELCHLRHNFKKWANEPNIKFFKGRNTNGWVQMLNMPGHKDNANQNHIITFPHFC
jgi:hypothetical protein